MWPWLKAILGAPAGKVGGLALKVWHVASLVALLGASAGAVAVVALRQPTPRMVVVVLSGIETSISDCREPPDLAGPAPLVALLASKYGFPNPYADGCPTATGSRDAPLDIAKFSYSGGEMRDGHWAPHDYARCGPNNLSLDQDSATLAAMLDAYRAAYPNARFELVGHSLGGLVALRGAYDYATKHGDGVITKVITLDSPLHGVRAGQAVSDALASIPCGAAAALVPPPYGLLAQYLGLSIVQALDALAATQGNYPENLAGVLAAKGTAVYTLGNTDDCLYRPALCYGALGAAFGDQTGTQFVEPSFHKGYSLGSAGLIFGGHGVILSDPGAVADIALLLAEAPAVTAHVTMPPGRDATLRVVASSRWGIKEVRAEVVGAEFSAIAANKQITLTTDGAPTSLDRTVALETSKLPNGKLLARVTAVVDGQGHTHLPQADADATGGTIDARRDFKAQDEFTNTNQGGGQTPGPSPTPAQTTIYVGANDGTLHALDASSGKPRWTFSTGGATAQALAASQGIVYAAEMDGVDAGYVAGKLYAIDATSGSALWHIDGEPTTLGGFGTGPVFTFEALENGQLYALLGNSVAAFDAKTGQQRWRYTPADGAISGFALAGTTALVSHDNKGANPALDAVSATTGARVWSQATTSRIVSIAAQGDAGIAYVGETDADNSVPFGDVSVEAFRGDSGARAWRFDGGNRFSIGLRAAGGRVYVTLGGFEGATFGVLDGQTGAQVWSSPLGCMVELPYPTPDAAYDACTNNTPAVSSDQAVAALDPATGRPRWRQELALGGSPSIGLYWSDDVLFAWAGSTFALDARSGNILWHRADSLAAARYGSAATAANDGKITVLDARSGAIRWTFSAGQQNQAPPVFIAAS